MIIIHIINNLQIGGAEKMLIKLIKNDKKNENIIFNLIGDYDLSDNDIKINIINFNFKSWNIFKLIYNLIKYVFYIIKLKPKIMVFWLYHSFIFSIVTKLIFFKKIKIIWNIRQTVPDFNYEKLTTKIVFKITSFFSNMPDYLIFNSKVSIKQHKILNFQNSNYILIPNGFEQPKIASKENKNFEEFIKNKYVVSMIARLHPSKGHKLFLKIIKEILKLNNNIVFFMAGRNVDSNNDIINFIKNNNIKNNLFLSKEIKNTDYYLSRSDILINCSFSSEGFPNIIGEAIMNNCIPLASDISDNKEILGSDLIVEQIDSFGFSSKIKYLYDLDKNKILKIKNRLKSKFTKNYSIGNISNEYNNIYEKVVNEDNS